ncbi:MAG: carboxymuconolactone decarboxylase family protein [Myxococcota bacterium]|nr:carboxymuconolactone decarboxylase family protein [Myxococcota bacterium]
MASSRHAELTAAWDRLARAGRNGPLDERTCRLVELAVAIGTRDRDAIRDAHQRAIELGAFGEEIDQLVALAAATIGKPATLAISTWLGLDATAGSAPTAAPSSNVKPSDA